MKTTKYVSCLSRHNRSECVILRIHRVAIHGNMSKRMLVVPSVCRAVVTFVAPRVCPATVTYWRTDIHAHIVEAYILRCYRSRIKLSLSTNEIKGWVCVSLMSHALARTRTNLHALARPVAMSPTVELSEISCKNYLIKISADVYIEILYVSYLCLHRDTFPELN